MTEALMPAELGITHQPLSIADDTLELRPTAPAMSQQDGVADSNCLLNNNVDPTSLKDSVMTTSDISETSNQLESMSPGVTNGSLQGTNPELRLNIGPTATHREYEKLSPRSKVGKVLKKYGSTVARSKLVAPAPPVKLQTLTNRHDINTVSDDSDDTELDESQQSQTEDLPSDDLDHSMNTSNNAEDEHVDENSMFCLDCHERVGSEASHSGHNLVKVQSAIDNQTKECESLLLSCEECKSRAAAHSDEISQLKSNLVKTRKAIAVELDGMFRELEHRLHERKMVLFTQLTDSSHHKECYLDDQIDLMSTVHEQCSNIAHDISQINENLSAADLIARHCHLLKESATGLSEQTEKIKGFSLAENTCLRFDRHGIAEVRKSLNTLASVTTSNVIPSKCTASGDGLKKCSVQKQTLVKVTARNLSGQVERERLLEIEAQLHNKEINVECQCIESGNGNYHVLYIAPEKGHYQLTIKLFNQHIKGSPFKINAVPGARVTFSKTTNAYELTRVTSQHDVNTSSPSVRLSSSSRLSSASPARTASPRSISSAESFSSLKILPSSPNTHSSVGGGVQPPYGDYLALIGQYGRRKGDFCNPQGVAVDYNGRIYCSDSSNQNIQIFTDSGSYISNLGKRGRQTGQLSRPIGICVTKDGCVVFTDYEMKCVNVFKDGAFIRRIGSGKMIGPKGLTTSPRGTIIVADNKGNQVLEFSINGRLIRKIESNKLDKAAKFAGPHYVAVNQSGDIYVSDFHNHSIKVFSRDGVFLRNFGHHGTGNGQFNAPTGISIDSKGYVLVSDWGNSRIQIFDEMGSFLSLVDTSASPLFGPQSIFTTRENTVIVADSGNHCVKIFKYETI